jgi:4-amino-4-deoxy-L-arabinose transferase-like glycosyltransferase
MAAGIATALLLALLALPALLWPNEFLRDDSYFYLQIADRIVEGQGSTFHGLTPTNGYHPLWMGGAIAAVAVAGGDREQSLLLVVLLQLLITLGAVLLLYRLCRHMELCSPAIAVAVLMIYLLGTAVYGSEAHLNALMLLAGLVSLWRALQFPRPARWFLTGLLFGLAVLARLDNVFVVLALCGLGAAWNAPRAPAEAFRCAVAGSLGGLLVLGPYLAWNVIAFGHLNPISGAIKSTFPQFAFEFGRLGPVGMLAFPFGLLALLAGLLLDREPRRRVLWLGLGSGVLAHAVYVAGFTDHYTFWPWYYVAGVVTAALFCAWLPGWLADRFATRKAVARLEPLAYLLALAILAAGTARTWLKVLPPIQAGPVAMDLRINTYRWPEEFGRWMKANLPPDSRIFVLDWPGAFAWYSELTVLPMDGLVNDFRYNDELLARGVYGYLCAHGIGYYAGLQLAEGPIEEVPVEAPLYRRAAGVLRLHEDDLVVKAREVVREPDRTLPFALWRLRCPDGATGMPETGAGVRGETS